MDKEQLPLELREEFGRYAFPDKDYGEKAIEVILPFLEGVDEQNNDSRLATVWIDGEGNCYNGTKRICA